MVTGIVNAFDHMGFCLVLSQLTTTCTDGKWAVIWPPNFATKYVSFATNFYTGYQLKKLIFSNSVIVIITAL